MPSAYQDAMTRLRYALSDMQHSRMATDLTGLTVQMCPETWEALRESAGRADRHYFLLMGIRVKLVEDLEPGRMLLVRTLEL